MENENIERVYVGGLFHAVKEEELRDKFKSFGKVNEVHIVHKKDSEGEVYKTFAYLNLQTNAQTLKKCFGIFGRSKWNGSEMKVQLAKEDFMARLKKEWENPIPEVKKSRKKRMAEPIKTYDEILEKSSKMRKGVPGTLIEGERNWVISKYGRPLPIVYIPKSVNKKLIKIDPSKFCHNLRKLNVECDSTDHDSLTWSLNSSSKLEKFQNLVTGNQSMKHNCEQEESIRKSKKQKSKSEKTIKKKKEKDIIMDNKNDKDIMEDKTIEKTKKLKTQKIKKVSEVLIEETAKQEKNITDIVKVSIDEIIRKAEQVKKRKKKNLSITPIKETSKQVENLDKKEETLPITNIEKTKLVKEQKEEKTNEVLIAKSSENSNENQKASPDDINMKKSEKIKKQNKENKVSTPIAKTSEQKQNVTAIKINSPVIPFTDIHSTPHNNKPSTPSSHKFDEHNVTSDSEEVNKSNASNLGLSIIEQLYLKKNTPKNNPTNSQRDFKDTSVDKDELVDISTTNSDHENEVKETAALENEVKEDSGLENPFNFTLEELKAGQTTSVKDGFNVSQYSIFETEEYNLSKSDVESDSNSDTNSDVEQDSDIDTNIESNSEVEKSPSHENEMKEGIALENKVEENPFNFTLEELKAGQTTSVKDGFNVSQYSIFETEEHNLSNSDIDSDADIESNSDVESDSAIESNSDVESDAAIESSSDVESDAAIERSSDVESDAAIENDSDEEIILDEKSNLTHTQINSVDEINSNVDCNSDIEINLDVKIDSDDKVTSNVGINMDEKVTSNVGINMDDKITFEVKCDSNVEIINDVKNSDAVSQLNQNNKKINQLEHKIVSSQPTNIIEKAVVKTVTNLEKTNNIVNTLPTNSKGKLIKPEKRKMREERKNTEAHKKKRTAKELEKKHALSEEARKLSIVKRSKLAKGNIDLVKKALSNLDTSTTNKNRIVFDDSDEDVGMEVDHKDTKEVKVDDVLPAKKGTEKLDLFGNSDEEDDAEQLFTVKKQFQGEEGEKLFKLQQRFGNDERFRLDERFAKESSDESDDNVQEEETGDQSKVTIKEEKENQFSILEGLLGKSIAKVRKGDKQKDETFERYDPSKEEHVQFIIKQAEKEDVIEVEEEVIPDEPAVEVSKETFFEVDSTIKDLFSKPTEKTSMFSFLGEAVESTEEQSKAESVAVVAPQTNKKELNWQKALDEAKDMQTEDIDVKDTSNVNDEVVSNPPNKLFSTADDKRPKIGKSFMRSEPIEVIEEQWKALRAGLVEGYKKKNKDAVRRVRKSKEKRPNSK